MVRATNHGGDQGSVPVSTNTTTTRPDLCSTPITPHPNSTSRPSLRQKDNFAKIYSKLNQDGENGVDVFELHTALVATNTLVPLDIVVQLFQSADKDADGSLSLQEFKDYLSRYEKLQQEGSAAMKRVMTNLLFCKSDICRYIYLAANIRFAGTQICHKT